MAKPKIKDEWKLWLFVGAIFVVIAGYLYFVTRPPMEGDEYLWQVMSVDEGGVLTAKGSGRTMKLRLVALEIPKEQAKAAQEMLTGVLQDKWVRIKPVKDDPEGVSEGFVYLDGEDMHSRIIRHGLGRIDKDAKAFDIRHYLELEMEAKKGKKGLWGAEDKGEK